MFFKDNSDDPNKTNDCGQDVNQDHFIEFEELFIDPGEKERCEGKQDDKKPSEDFFEPRVAPSGRVCLHWD